MGDDVHHRRILAPNLVTVIELVFKLLKELLPRTSLLHSMIINRVSVREFDQQFFAYPDGIRHFIVVKVAVIFETGFSHQLHRIVRRVF